MDVVSVCGCFGRVSEIWVAGQMLVVILPPIPTNLFLVLTFMADIKFLNCKHKF